MTKLTDAQLIVLTSACKRDDGLAVLPAGMKPTAAAKLAAGLVNKGLVREIRAKSGTPIWREDEEGRKYGLKLLKAGREAIGVEEEGEEPDTVQPAADPMASARAGTKRALVIDLLQRPKGATLEELIAATGWLPHTTRAALSVLRRSGMVIERSRTETGKPSVYRIVAMPAAEAA